MRLLAATVAAATIVSMAFPSAGQELPVFRVGVLNDQSGLYSDIAGLGSVEAAKMAVEDFKPEEKGFRVEILAADHQNKTDIGSNVTRQWFDRENVDVVADVPTSSIALAVSEITKSQWNG
jgi:branched-chain amino acid transport system substrate-binding protein